jgi:hypothetical protein
VATIKESNDWASSLNPEEDAMSTTVIERELSEQTFAAIWRYVKCILRMHVSGIIDEAEAKHKLQRSEGAERAS